MAISPWLKNAQFHVAYRRSLPASTAARVVADAGEAGQAIRAIRTIEPECPLEPFEPGISNSSCGDNRPARRIRPVYALPDARIQLDERYSRVSEISRAAHASDRALVTKARMPRIS